MVYGSYIHTGGKSGGELLTLFDSYSYDGVTAGIWVIHTGAKSGCKHVTLFGGYSYDGVSAGIWVIHTDRCQIWVQTGDAFWQLLL